MKRRRCLGSRTLGWQVAHGPDIAPDTLGAERAEYGEVVLGRRLRDAFARLNSDLPASALDDAFRKLTRPEGSALESRNRAFHRMLVDGVTVEYRNTDGAVRGAQSRVIDSTTRPTTTGSRSISSPRREPDTSAAPMWLLFVNGLPLAVVELKNPADEGATIWIAWQQLQTYKAEIPSLFACNAALAVSDGLDARIGTLTAGREWFKPWRTISGEALADPRLPQLQVMIEGVCEPSRFLALIRDFIVFEDDGSGALVKKMAGYHQLHAVQTAVAETLRAAELQREVVGVAEAAGRYESGRQAGGEPGDRRIGVVWHTQGSGKSLTMAFYAGRIIREPAMHNPTIVVLTDRNDLDDQLFSTFSRCRGPVATAPGAGGEPGRPARQAVGGSWRRGVHHHPEVLPRREGRPPSAALRAAQHCGYCRTRQHRSQYDFIDGYARHMRDALPNASFIGLYRHPHRACRRQHPRRLRRPYQRLRHSARGARWGDRADLLREPPRPAGARRAGTPGHRPRFRGRH